MEKRGIREYQVMIVGIVVALAMVFSSTIIGRYIIKIKKLSTQVVSVTGAAEEYIVSDYAVWRVSFARRDADMKVAYQKIADDAASVKTYLGAQGVSSGEMIVAPMATEILYVQNEKGGYTHQIEGFKLSQTIEVRSKDVERITQLSRQCTELINQGIEMVSFSPEYFYTKLADLKIEMLRKAALDAQLRAKTIAEATGNRIGIVRSARMGVFQITPRYSCEVADCGINDTSSLEKKVTAIVHADFILTE